MDQLIAEFEKQRIVYEKTGEYQELSDALKLDRIRKIDLKNADERYRRYLNGIDIWTIKGVSYDYIRQNIHTFLSIQATDENFLARIHWMKVIDHQINEALK
jgi:hypothetical protein